MSIVRPFCALRPRPDLSQAMACLPYDVMSRQEAAEMAKGNPSSFLRVIRADAFLPATVDEHADEVYEASAAQLQKFIDDGSMAFDDSKSYYIYRQFMNDQVQTGIVACVSVDEYKSGDIKKHELTLAAKEQDRIRHFDACDMSTEPIFLTYRAHDTIDRVIGDWIKAHNADVDIVLEDGTTVRHQLWRLADPNTIHTLTQAFQQVSALYIADGHHRSASTAAVCEKRRAEAASNCPDEDHEYEYMMAVVFADHDLHVMDYNRIICDLNGLTQQEFFDELRQAGFTLSVAESSPFKPQAPHSFGMYLDGQWYVIEASQALYQSDDAVERLDVSILQKHLLEPVLGVGDPRTDERIRAVGGIRGLDYLANEVDKAGKGVAFSMYPVSIAEIMEIADNGQIMPPKSTWFEPKLASGLFAHALYDHRKR